MGESSGAYNRVLVRKPEERGHLEDQGVDGRIILRWIFRKWDGSMDCIYLAQDKHKWQALVNEVMNVGVL
jgi:hypothetical protein